MGSAAPQIVTPGQVQRPQWSIQNKRLSQPQDRAEVAFDLERAACACSGAPSPRRGAWADGRLADAVPRGAAQGGALRRVLRGSARRCGRTISDLSVTDRFDGNFNEQDLCEKILFAEIRKPAATIPTTLPST